MIHRGLGQELSRTHLTYLERVVLEDTFDHGDTSRHNIAYDSCANDLTLN